MREKRRGRRGRSSNRPYRFQIQLSGLISGDENEGDQCFNCSKSDPDYDTVPHPRFHRLVAVRPSHRRSAMIFCKICALQTVRSEDVYEFVFSTFRQT